MKNIVIVDVDTERENQVMIKKSTEFEMPSNDESLAEMIKIDIICLCGGLCSMIQFSDENNLGTKEDYIKATINTLNELLEKS